MNVKKVLTALTAGATFAVVVVIGSLCGTGRALADDDGEQSRVRIGFEIAPVPLNLAGKNRALVGLGSYLVNVLDHCNTCHSAGPAAEFAKGGNPYFKGNQPTVVNQATAGRQLLFPLTAFISSGLRSSSVVLPAAQSDRPEAGQKLCIEIASERASA